MSTNSAIQWTDATWNPVSGCTRVSAGCDHCYAVKTTHRLAEMGMAAKYGGLTVLNANGDRHFNGKVRTHDDALEIPLGWRKPRRIFVNSMSDLFHKEVPFEFIDKVFAVMALCPQHTFQILTKRPERMAEYFSGEDLPKFIANEAWVSQHDPDVDVDCSDAYLDEWPLPNVHLGTSAERQQELDDRIGYLLKCPAAVRFLSLEPLLGPIRFDAIPYGVTEYLDGTKHPCRFDCLQVNPDSPDLNERQYGHPGIHWVIVGGESGHNARPCNVEWIRSIIGQCKAAGVPCFVKQLGSSPMIREGLGSSVKGRAEDEERELKRWPEGTHFGNRSGIEDYNGRQAILDDPKGGDILEWPEDLRVREMPGVRA